MRDYTKAQIEAMDEKQLRGNVLVPLLMAMGYQDVRDIHSSAERGRDIICCQIAKDGSRTNFAVVVKTVRLNGKASVSKASAGEIYVQICECLGEAHEDPHEIGQKRRVDKVIVVSNLKGEQGFVNTLGSAIRGNEDVLGKVLYWDGQKVWALYRQYLHSLIAKVSAVQLELDQRNPNLVSEIHVILRPRQGGTTRVNEEPIIRFTFHNLPGQDTLWKSIEGLQSQGDTAAIPAASLANVDLPPELKQLIEDAPGGVLEVSAPMQVAQVPAIAASIELIPEDGESFWFDYVDFRLSEKHGSKYTFTNKSQGRSIITQIRLVLDMERQFAKINFDHDIQARENAFALLQLLKFRRCLTGPVRTKVYDVTTNITWLELDATSPSTTLPDSEFMDVISDLAAIQARIRQAILIPTDRPWTQQETEDVAEMRTIFHKGGYEVTWGSESHDVPRAEAKRLLELLKDDAAPFFRRETSYATELFGTDIPLGRGIAKLYFKLANEEEVRKHLAEAGSEEDTVRMEFEPAESGSARLEFPDWKPAAG